MIPNLTLIVAAYCLVRLLDVAARHFRARDSQLGMVIALLAVAACVLIVLCTLDTLGTGLSIGSTIDAQKGQHH